MKPKHIEAVNDFVIKFANVNGSGSASANELFARSILRMGVPVSPRNIFPSNIQGLPTWYEVRVTEKGWLGRRGGVDLMVAMNPQTWNQDLAEITPGGYLFYDSTRPLPASRLRDDINILGMPLTDICNATYDDSRQRQLFKNIIYVGALAALLDMDAGAIAELIGEQYKGKEKLLKPNLNAMQMGRDYALAHLKCPIGLRVKRADAVGNKIFMEGNSATALGAVYGGATVCAWYPITPSSSVAEAFERYCKRLRVDEASGKNKFAIVQAEDELASIGIVTGAGWNGARAFTATSGPGISLMTEFIGLAYFAEIPVTIVDVQRGGPSTGMPTRTQQADILSTAYASHGDTKHVILFPEDPKECFEFTAHALDLADRLHRHHLGALSFARGVSGPELEEALKLIARDADRGGEPLGLQPLSQIAAWPHVRLYPLTFDRLELVGEEGGEGSAAGEVTGGRGAQLWVGLARAALGQRLADAQTATGRMGLALPLAQPADPAGARVIGPIASKHVMHLVDQPEREVRVRPLARQAREPEEVTDGEGVRPQVPLRGPVRREPGPLREAPHEQGRLLDHLPDGLLVRRHRARVGVASAFPLRARGCRVRRIQGLKLLRRQRERERDGVFLDVGDRPGFRYRHDIAPADGPGQRDRGGRATTRGGNARERGITQQCGA